LWTAAGSALLKSIDDHKLVAMRQLLEAGVDPNQQIKGEYEEESRTPLISLAFNRGLPENFQMEALKMLVHCGAKIDQTIDDPRDTQLQMIRKLICTYLFC